MCDKSICSHVAWIFAGSLMHSSCHESPVFICKQGVKNSALNSSLIEKIITNSYIYMRGSSVLHTFQFIRLYIWVYILAWIHWQRSIYQILLRQCSCVNQRNAVRPTTWTVPQLSIMIIYNCTWSILIQ